MGSKKKAAKEKPLEKMTAKELREVAKDIPEIVGVHGMNKPELIVAIKGARGLDTDVNKKSNASVRDIKKKIRKLKRLQAEAQTGDNARMATVYRRRISRLKKKTRRAA
jgi:hypothetical protein